MAPTPPPTRYAQPGLTPNAAILSVTASAPMRAPPMVPLGLLSGSSTPTAAAGRLSERELVSKAAASSAPWALRAAPPITCDIFVLLICAPRTISPGQAARRAAENELLQLGRKHIKRSRGVKRSRFEGFWPLPARWPDAT